MRDMPTDRAAWRRLAQQVVDERASRGWTQTEVADRGGFSVDRLQEIEKGDRSTYRPTTLGALERGLRWTRGSVRRVLAGEPPERESEVETSVPEVMHETPPSRVEQGTPETVRAISEDPVLTDRARRHLLDQYDMLRELSQGSHTKEDDRPVTPAVERPLRAVARKRPPRSTP